MSRSSVVSVEASMSAHVLSEMKNAALLPLALRPPCSDSSDEIPFAQFNTAVPQDVVGRSAVEIKVG